MNISVMCEVIIFFLRHFLFFPENSDKKLQWHSSLNLAGSQPGGCRFDSQAYLREVFNILLVSAPVLSRALDKLAILH